MNAKELLYETQKEYVASKYGLGEPIVYSHSSGTIVSLNAFVDGNDFSVKDKIEVHNECVFSNVILEETPTITDTVSFNDLIWKVRDWKLQGKLYIIYTDNSKRNRITTKKRK
ncbi:MAG: hypothetical protein JJV88_00285 [Sulfurovum sp.]|nr:hypothetical protein [Sulfurovaceae bacterium]